MSVESIQHAAAEGASKGEYRGAAAAAQFGDIRAEYLAFRQGCALVAMPWRAKLLVSGADRVRWLNGMITNNVRDLAPDHGVYAFLLTAQGRILADMHVYQRGDYLLVSTDAAQKKIVLDTFEHFIIMDDVELADVSDKLISLAVFGPHARKIMARAGLEVLPLDPLQVIDFKWNAVGLSVARGGSQHFDSYELWLAPENFPTLYNALKAAGSTPVGYQALEMFRISMGVPAYGIDIRERDLPQETGQMHALHFVKGCYVGQEIVERIRARGNVHRGFVGFLVSGVPPAPGTKVQVGGKDVGEITSAARLPASPEDITVAIGYLRREAGGPGAKVQIADSSATVAALPFQS